MPHPVNWRLHIERAFNGHYAGTLLFGDGRSLTWSYAGDNLTLIGEFTDQEQPRVAAAIGEGIVRLLARQVLEERKR